MATKYRKDKVNLPERTLIKRLNRFLAGDGHKLLKNRKTRSGQKKRLTQREIDLGTFYLVSGKEVVEKHLDLEVFARKHGVLMPYEVLAPE